MGLFNIFSGAGNDTALSNETVIDISRPGLSVKEALVGGGRAINLNHVIDTGEIPAMQFFGSDLLTKGALGALDMEQEYIDWQSEDTFTKAIDGIETRTIERLAATPDMQVLLEQDEWSREDRTAWERGLSEIVSAEMNATPGLGEYRTGGAIEDQTGRYNDLAADLDNSTRRMDFDCQAMSVIEGSVLQRVENALLPDEAATDNLKTASNYFLVSGAVSPSSGADIISHQYIMAPSGNIIEATYDPDITAASPYRETANQGFGLGALAIGQKAVTTDGAVYGGDMDATDAETARMAVQPAVTPPQTVEVDATPVFSASDSAATYTAIKF